MLISDSYLVLWHITADIKSQFQFMTELFFSVMSEDKYDEQKCQIIA